MNTVESQNEIDQNAKEGFKKTKLGWIPEEWKISEIGDKIELGKKRFNPKTNIETKKCIELENIDKETATINGYFDSNDLLSTKTVFSKGDTLFGKLRPNLRKYWRATFDGVCSSEIWVLKPKRDTLNKKFLLYFLQQERFYQISNITSGSKMPRANWSFIQNFPMLFPPLAEQKAIASCLSTWDTAITKLDALIKAKQQLKKALMQQLLSGKKRLPGFEGVWEEKRLGMYLEQSLQKVKKENTYEVLTSARSGLVKQSEYYESGRLSSKSSIDFNIINKDELTYRSRTDDGTFKFNLNSLGIDGCVSKYYPVLKSSTSIEFFSYFLNYYNIKIGKFATGSSQLVLSFNELSKIKFYLPEKDEQTAITQVLNTADQEINLLTAQRNQLQLQKNGLMQQLLTGKMRLKV